MPERRVGRNTPPNFLFAPVRTRVLTGIEATGARARAIGIVAPVGYGKTVLMASLFARRRAQGEQCFWTALDDRDNTVERVVVLLEEMTYRHSERLHPTQALFRGDEPLESRIDRLVEAAANHPRPFTAFIDNLDSCTDERLDRVLDRLLFETPETVRFVFSSTTDLPLNLARAKLEGLVRQIGYPELSLDSGEVAELLGKELCTAIGMDGVGAVTQQTEGWPAAVRLVQIVLAASDQPRSLLEKFSGSDEDLAALLNRQVLSGFSAELRQFLVDIAPLRTFCADLCRHASGNDEAEQHLALLLKRNVFVIPLDRNRTWYRLHGLFREYLLGEADHGRNGVRRQKVLARAAAWCEENGYRREAVDYALAAGAGTAASRILNSAATEFVRDRGDIPQYIAWVEACHARRWTLGWETDYWYLWALVFNRRYEYARQQMQRLARQLGQAPRTGTESRDDKQRRLDIIQVSLDIFTDRLADARRNAEHWLTDIDTDDAFNVTAARCVQSIYFSSAFLFVEAREAAQAAQGSAFQTGSAYARGWIVALSTLPSVLEGNYAQIHPELTAALATLRSTLGEGAGIYGTVALLAAQCAVEMGLDDEARALLTLGMRTSQAHGFVDAVACGLDAAVKLWHGSGDEPFPLAQLREIAGSYPPRLTFMLSCFVVRRLLRLDRRSEAWAEAVRIGLAPDTLGAAAKFTAVARARDAYVAAEIELCLASELHKRAETLIVEETRRARSEGRAARLVELALDEAVLAARTKDPTAGNRHLTRAVSLAAARGIVRPFNDRAAMIATLVEDTRPSEWGFALAQERRFFADICRRLPISNRALQEKLVLLNLETHLLDPLTKRQVELLGLLDAGLSNQQIADRLHVTLTTIKGHLQKLYAKLGVSSRAAALARARALSLL